jgi:hypothetical protein
MLEDEKRLDMAVSLAERNSLVWRNALRMVDTNGDDSRTTASSALRQNDSTSRPGKDLSMRRESASRSVLAANTISDGIVLLVEGSKIVDRVLSPSAIYDSGVLKNVSSAIVVDVPDDACFGEDFGDDTGEDLSGLGQKDKDASNFVVIASAKRGETSCASAGRRVVENDDD